MQLDEAESGTAALRCLARERYRVVFLDELRDDGVDGFSVLEQLRQSEPTHQQTPVVMTATTVTEELVARANGLGVEYVLHKPVHAFVVRDAVRAIMDPQQRGQGATPEHPAHPVYEDERRQVPRLRLVVAAHFSNSPGTPLTTWDINPFGAFFASDDLPRVGERARLHLALPHLDHELATECTVMHIRAQRVGRQPRGFGVRFDPATSEEARRLMDAFTSPGGIR